MNTQKRERSRLAYILPDPTVTSGECVLQGITSDGVIDWEHVCHLWVFPVNNDNGVAYAPCVVFLDNSWAMIGPIGTLEAARQLCFRWSALHDRGVCDQTRPAAPAPVVRTGRLVDVPPSELPNTLPGDPWTFNEHQNRFQLDLLQLGIGIANEAEGITLEERIAQVDAKLQEISSLFRASDVIQPHPAKTYITKAREAAVFWATEAQAIEDAEVDTPEDTARNFVDDIRKGGSTFAEAYDHLNQYIAFVYGNMTNEDGSPFADRAAYAKRAYDAGYARLQYFLKQAAPQ